MQSEKTTKPLQEFVMGSLSGERCLSVSELHERAIEAGLLTDPYVGGPHVIGTLRLLSRKKLVRSLGRGFWMAR